MNIGWELFILDSENTNNKYIKEISPEIWEEVSDRAFEISRLKISFLVTRTKTALLLSELHLKPHRSGESFF